jgi:hypothetical protein
MSKLITSGCGISQRDFKHYPIWVHFPTISHKLKHISIGGPAVGNEYIGRTCKKHILENLDVEAVIIQWTSIGKLDLFVENENTLDEIKDFNLRNFVVDMNSSVVNHKGFWPSSNSSDNFLKELYNNNFKSKIYDHIKDLEYILDIQTLCELHGIPYYFFFGYEFDFEFIRNTSELEHLYKSINWNKFMTRTPMYDLYQNSDEYKLDIFDKDPRYMSPNSAFQISFYIKYIIPILNERFTPTNFDITRLENHCIKLAKEMKDT